MASTWFPRADMPRGVFCLSPLKTCGEDPVSSSQVRTGFVSGPNAIVERGGRKGGSGELNQPVRFVLCWNGLLLEAGPADS